MICCVLILLLNNIKFNILLLNMFQVFSRNGRFSGHTSFPLSNIKGKVKTIWCPYFNLETSILPGSRVCLLLSNGTLCPKVLLPLLPHLVRGYTHTSPERIRGVLNLEAGALKTAVQKGGVSLLGDALTTSYFASSPLVYPDT